MTYLDYLRTCLGLHIGRLRDSLRDGQRGASAVELAIITVVLLGVAAGIGLAIKTFVGKANTQIQGTNP